MARGRVGVRASVDRLVRDVKKHPHMWRMVELELRHAQQISSILDRKDDDAPASMHKQFIDVMRVVRERLSAAGWEQISDDTLHPGEQLADLAAEVNRASST